LNSAYPSSFKEIVSHFCSNPAETHTNIGLPTEPKNTSYNFIGRGKEKNFKIFNNEQFQKFTMMLFLCSTY